jgi:superfamily I DNA/RNA helicase
MVNLSAEQKAIIETILSNKNCLVDAVAGSGKTTTVMGLAQTDPTKHILQITYNRHLKDEVNDKVIKANITNMNVYTYHGLCVRYYNHKAHTDAIMKSVLHKDTKPRQTIAKFDILVIDETQDMNILFFHFIRKFLRDYNKPITILVLGDKFQSINEFRGADRRFLTLAAELFKSYGDFVNLTLKTSYRLTNQIAAFINNKMLGENRIETVRDGPKVEFMRNNVWRSELIVEKIVKLIESKRYSPGDIFVLAGSTRSKRGEPMPINMLEQALVSRKIPCFGTNDDEELSSNLTEGKVVFSTIHQSKGRERPIVIF